MELMVERKIGRPAKDPTTRVNLRINTELLARLDHLVEDWIPRSERGAHIEAAIREYLDRKEAELR